ncbi:uncharacterized protein B0T15DRAFT_514968 [Chaetomium strumarium]|uniref:Uncharacterized protein n=1 Tax=Chaetomium strumarium TaxID=1170767 RepID=A0AAJ0LXX6_9PEZI|nr:hypothetical protein B0T15DRAFT_514968 [Chaetomium strumarium]
MESIDRDVRRQQRSIQVAYDRLPTSLYDKARDHQDQLTDEERQLLLSRGDVLGKALAYPDSLTTDEIHEARGWPPPDVVRTNIQRATGGSLSTTAELHAKAKDALDHGQFDTVISDDEAFLIAHKFYARDDYSLSKCEAVHQIPGFGHVDALLSRRLGPDLAVWKASVEREFEAMGPLMEAAPPMDPIQRAFRKYMATPPSRTDMQGSGPWPVTYAGTSAYQLFGEDTDSPSDLPFAAAPRWAALPEQQKEVYRAQDEARRREAWADYERRIACKDAGLPAPPPPRPVPPPSADFLEYFRISDPTRNPVLPLSGFEVFRDDLVAGDAGLGFGEVLARWEALTDQQRDMYEMRAREAKKAGAM